MADLREQPAIDAKQAADEAVFLEYHDNSPWAKAKVKAGLRLNPQAVNYMTMENEARRDGRARFAEDNAAFEEIRRRDAGLPPAEKKPDAQQ